jgi:hypothetical protein
VQRGQGGAKGAKTRGPMEPVHWPAPPANAPTAPTSRVQRSRVDVCGRKQGAQSCVAGFENQMAMATTREEAQGGGGTRGERAAGAQDVPMGAMVEICRPRGPAGLATGEGASSPVDGEGPGLDCELNSRGFHFRKNHHAKRVCVAHITRCLRRSLCWFGFQKVSVA